MFGLNLLKQDLSLKALLKPYNFLYFYELAGKPWVVFNSGNNEAEMLLFTKQLLTL